MYCEIYFECLSIFFFTDAKSKENVLQKIKEIARDARKFEDSVDAFLNKDKYSLNEIASLAGEDDKSDHVIEGDADNVEGDAAARKFHPRGKSQ